ncbi:UbiH/UbiF/VisC/COQ6 family ubiquinone biosynthesis hydroxylase [Kangiella sediminilitoris]|uniref:Ubiquinone biosynthesis hydroxylase, UbiH/UbiF/VisC/COQ6 family n=1 Tax=Kangiella sediminilitoris TaxID=1144748 RepID=A0A1B3B7W5_9GAMM|nr:UbiH/UbiF/VisC/COQ6 family ubiquinone biosynthesis hydroxylase [Kangiella sediminilitoris]AOE48885.1 Ubiquinone biosynthesis hydroxylase, UbiH/UbiF/VisC/COQ6 family [Kangiella sediminilitoris]
MSASSDRRNKVDYDITIVGGGMVGLALACRLASEDLTIAVIEPKPVEMQWPEGDVDQRVSAITRASQRLFESIGAWEQISASEKAPYRRMIVWDGESTQGEIEFDASLIAEPNLGHIIENRVLRRSLFKVAEKNRNINWMCPYKCQEVAYHDDFAELTLNSGERLKSSLLVAADGAFSWLRKASGIGQKQQPYGHKAIVCTVKTERSHQATAWQRFDHDGPLAFLPLADEHTCSIVWSVKEERANQLLQAENFNQLLQQRFENRLGNISVESDLVAFPLFERATEQMVAERLALIGDAAHTIHPLAGQGVNLGFADAEELAQCIHTSIMRKADIGKRYRLRPFERARKAETKNMQLAMMGFKRLFEQEIPIIQMARSYGLAQTNKHPLLKQKLIRQAMGI